MSCCRVDEVFPCRKPLPCSTEQAGFHSGLAREPDTDVSALRASPEFARLRGRLTEIMRG
ncbi:hypothetical protein ACFXGI_37825 [Streptomyces sp. NPDC059355]|uniref:hypothetical protein n=1 Tax=Streptomyces sp. NPDC059355 TaxID=3346811 RepID=UPI0036B90C83